MREKEEGGGGRGGVGIGCGRKRVGVGGWGVESEVKESEWRCVFAPLPRRGARPPSTTCRRGSSSMAHFPSGSLLFTTPPPSLFQALVRSVLCYTPGGAAAVEIAAGEELAARSAPPPAYIETSYPVVSHDDRDCLCSAVREGE